MRVWRLETYKRTASERKAKRLAAWGATFTLGGDVKAQGWGHTERVAVIRAAEEALRLESQLPPTKETTT